MSLLVWYPLISDMRNQGVGDADLTVSSSPSFGSGKIGNALIGGGSSTWTAVQTSKIFNNNTISICFWIYIDAPEGDTTAAKKPMIFGNDGMGHRKYSLFQYPSVNDLHWSWNTSADSTYYGSVAYGALPSYKWTHVAITYDNPSVKVYLNGELKATSSIAMNWNNFADETQVFRECQYRKLNDFRVYSNCLSPKEVKEISKGLVLHYPLNRGGFGQDNIIAGSSSIEKQYTYPTSSYKDWYAPTTTIIPTGTQYILSFYAKSTVNGDKIRTHFYSPNTTTTCISSQGTTKTATDGNMDFTLSTEWKRYWVVYTQTETTAVKHVICPRLVSGQGTGTVSIKCVKLEEGSIATPWIPNSADPLYSAMGLDSNVEYDVSGNNYNGTSYNSFASISDTPRYNTAMHFTPGSGVFAHPSITFSQFTIAFWARHTATGKMLFGSNASPSSLNSTWYWYGDNSFKYPSGEFYYEHNAGSDSSLLNKWTFFAATYDGAKVTVYRNGIYEGNKAVTGDMLLDYVSVGNGFSSSNYWEDGDVSDFRIYATALSADDILELYHTPVSIASNGTLLTQGEISEV